MPVTSEVPAVPTTRELAQTKGEAVGVSVGVGVGVIDGVGLGVFVGVGVGEIGKSIHLSNLLPTNTGTELAAKYKNPSSATALKL